ncbi:MAG: hypothetical protein H0T76_09625 [Nannocystis sp.]|nr:hypothetical protein [Nannocystis sp.]MBA3546728.1 hypothetical protein [Nannocystis sp.]
MLRPLARALSVLLAAPLAAACTQSNPLFIATSGADTTTAASTLDITTDAPGSSAPDPDTGSEGSSAGAPTTSDIEPDPTATTGIDPIDTGIDSDASTGEPPPDTSTGDIGPSTGDPPPEPVVEIVFASLATCVLLNLNFLGYLGPIECETLTEKYDQAAEIGVMILDKSVLAAGGRESRVYIRFEIPAAPADKVLTSATLSVEVSGSPDAGAAWSGDLYLSQPFDANSLKTFAPGGDLMTPDPSPAIPGQASSWQIPVEAIGSAQPLYLGIGALSSDAVAFRSTGASADLHPRLTLTYQ